VRSRKRNPWTLRRSRWLLVATVALFVVSFALATVTQASSGLIGYFDLGGEFEGAVSDIEATGAAVNASGAGSASPGDIYVYSGGVRQLSASDEFIRLWGVDTVKSGPGQADETQAVRLDATSGTFKLSFGADTTADLAVNATATQLEAALNALPLIGSGGVGVTGGPGNAGGTTPYIVTFDGPSLAGTDQPLLEASDGSAPLGGGNGATTYTINNGGSGFEICEPANGDECRDSGKASSEQIAIDQSDGSVYVSESERIDKYSASGQFIRGWGNDAVAAGPDDSNINEQKSVTVKASGGTFTLGYRRDFQAAVQSTPPLPYNASAEAVETSLNNLSEIGDAQSSVTVTGGPGDLNGTNPYLITFHGLLGGDDLGDDVLVSNPNGLTISSGGKAADVETVTEGGGEEICGAADRCKAGNQEETSGGLAFRSFRSSLAVAPFGAPNAGNVIAGNGVLNRVQEYDPEGDFVRAFGWDVDETEPSTGFEVCTAESNHVCSGGTDGDEVGQFGTLLSVAEDSSGAIYTAEGVIGNRLQPGTSARVQKFTPAGGLNLTPAPFGTSEVQSLTVNAAAGQFRLSFGIENDIYDSFAPATAEGIGDLSPGSNTITNVSTTLGEFEVGMPIVVPARVPVVFITSVGAHTLTISSPINNGVVFGNNQILRSTRRYRTASLPFNASASEVEAALNALPSISKDGGSVSVSGSSPYSITFDGGPMARTDAALIGVLPGATPLSGGSGTGANTASVATTTPGGPGGARDNSAPIGLGIGSADHILVGKFFPDTFATCADGVPSPREIRVEELDSSGTVLGTSSPCTGLEGFQGETGFNMNVTANPVTGNAYLLNENREGSRLNIFGPTGSLPSLSVEPVSNIGTNRATISGTANPNGPGTDYPDTTGTPNVTKTTYRIEFRKASDSAWTQYTPDIPVGNGTGPVSFSVGVDDLAPNTEYELKVVAVKPFTGSVEATRSLTTLPAGPEVEAFSSGGVSVDAATLHALINPQGLATSYHFEYGTTPSYGNSTPETSIGASHSGQAVQDEVEGLSDVLYHFRVIATNSSGTTTSADQTFTFHPPVCPNQAIRQQTRAAYLPDCRAYELVSPEDAGGTTLYTGGPQSPYASNPPRLAFVGQLAAVPNSGDRNPVNTAGDLYVASRGTSGWNTRYVGPSSEEVGCVGGRPLISAAGNPTTIQNDVMADPGLNRLLDWNLGNPLECAFGSFGNVRPSDHNTSALGSNAPYVWNAHGDFIDRWPTSAADVPGSEATFACPQDPSLHPYPIGVFGNVPVSYFCSTYVDASKDLSHFVFSTRSGQFGEGGLSAAPGSAYDNDTIHNTLHLISKLPNGTPITQEPGAKAGPEELIRFPSVSADGSHILMATATKPECKQADFPVGGRLARPLCPIVTQPAHLYTRVNNTVTYDVSGKPVHYVGATPDGTHVYFTSGEQLTGDDTDTSSDLYMWSENDGTPQLTRISRGEAGQVGNTDDCAASWTTDCDIGVYEDSGITTADGNLGGLGTFSPETTNPGYTDNAIAAKSGDIYFYSPEQLVAGRGGPGKENLYVYRGDHLSLVAALSPEPYCIDESLKFEGGTVVLHQETCSEGAAGRLQVTPDGRFAAFVTTSRLTAYDNEGFAEMYRYDADTEKVQCVSCRLDGSAPENDVLGSQGGRFITDDGRVFFTEITYQGQNAKSLTQKVKTKAACKGKSKNKTGRNK
jgi:hypothetical protein